MILFLRLSNPILKKPKLIFKSHKTPVNKVKLAKPKQKNHDGKIKKYI
jgi:hypothetical protein